MEGTAATPVEPVTRGVTQAAERLAQAKGIALICAPPGFGKTRLLWEAAVPVAKARGLDIRYWGEADHRADRRAADALRQAEPGCLLLIDDVAYADKDGLADALRLRGLDRACPDIWVAMDHPGQLALARLSAGGMLTEIDANSLRLDDSDLRARIGRIPPKFRKRVGELSRDWPVACALLCRWAQQASVDVADWCEADMLLAAGLAAFIDQEVAPLLTSQERDALIHASIAEGMEIAASPAQRDPSARAVLSAAHKLPGLVDRTGNRLHMQPALRAWLNARFEELPFEQQRGSLERMAEALAHKGELMEAARLYNRAGLEERIAALAKDHGSLLIWIRHGFLTVEQLVAQAGDAMVARSSNLQLMRCIVFIKRGRIADAQKLFDAILLDGADPIMLRDHEMVRVMLLHYGCSMRRSTDIDQFRAKIGAGLADPGWQSLLSTLTCILLAHNARFEAAQASLAEARVHARNGGSRYNLMFLSLHEASIHLAQGLLKPARAALSDARRRWRQEYPDDQGAETVMYGLMSSLEYEAGQLTSARASMRRSAYRLPDSEAWFDIYAVSYEAMARILAVDHGLDAAIETLKDHRHKLVAQGLPRVAWLLQRLGDILQGEAWLRGDFAEPEAIVDPGLLDVAATWQEREAFNLAAAYRLLRLEEADAARRMLADVRADAEARGLMRSALRYRLLEVASLLADDRKGEAEGLLRDGLKLGAKLGARQVFAHHMNGAMVRLIATVASRDQEGQDVLVRFARSLKIVPAEPSDCGSLVLSVREREVLAALAEGGSDKTLGRLLGMTEHGVRFHLKSIYRKLDVHDRVSAIHRAKSLGAV